MENLTNTVIDYGYKTTGWKDQLISYNGNNGFVYDSLGNPTTYKGKTLTWERGRNLISFNGVTFKYNAEGIRTSKTAGGITTKYYLDGSKILKEERSDGANIWYHYGTDGIAGLNYNGTEYIYRKNLQGDITHIFKADGTLLVKYVYDAWGNHEGVLDTNNSEAVLIANLNPFRYRSYYYDSSIGLYYLNSRYYDCEIGRFINADDISYLDPESINGLNLYAYCLNNPVCNYDPSGRFVLTAFLIGLIIGVVVGAVVGGVVAYNMAKASGAEGWELFGWTMLGIFGGAVIGGLIGGALGYFAGIAFPAINTFLASTLTFGGGGFALVGAGGTIAAGATAVSVSSIATVITIATAAALGGLVFMSKPDSGRIKYSDGTGYNDDGSKMTQQQSEQAYKNMKDPVKKANLRRWMKGQGYRTNHLKGLIFLPLVGEWLRRMFTGDW